MRNFTEITFILLIGCLAASLAHSQGLDRGERRAFARNCRADIVEFCSAVRPGAGAVADCLRQHSKELSKGCRANLHPQTQVQASEESGRARLPIGITVHRDISYGSDEKQRFDVYVPQGATNSPVIFMVHGGAWSDGSKASADTVDNKVRYWLPKGFIFISVDNRLLPEADPLVQVNDVARALAAAQQTVPSFGGDPHRFILMGHSAGAHLIALLSADPALAAYAGAQPWRGTVALDTAAYDLSKIMQDPHPRFYDRVFGVDPAFWRQASPTHRLHAGLQPILLVCSSKRSNSCPQANEFANKARSLGVQARVLPVDKNHLAINKDLGKAEPFTATIDSFIHEVIH